jgi:single-strand DNA-binding protein
LASLHKQGYGCEIIAEKVDFLSRPKTAEGEGPELVDNNDEVGC